jgi:hypothetical protein
MNLKVGDWVRSYSQGIWRIERIISDFYEIRYSTSKPKVKSAETQVVLKRLVNNKWKRSFSVESCDLSYLKMMSSEEMITLQNFIHSNEKTMKDFEKYQRNIDLVMNIRFSYN